MQFWNTYILYQIVMAIYLKRMLAIKQLTLVTTNKFKPSGTNFYEILIKIQNFSIHENAFDNRVCEMVAILSRGDE